MSLDQVNKTHIIVRHPELLCAKTLYRMTATFSHSTKAPALASAEPVIIALMQFTDAVHNINETSKAVEQLICDDWFRTRYGCSANQFCRPALLRAITFEPKGTKPQTWLLTNVV